MSDILIYAMSTRGSMKLEQFNELFRIAYLPAIEQDEESIEVDARRQVIRILDSLGYCEFDFDSRTVHMCRPSLVLLPGIGLPRVLLVGARTPALVQKLKDAVRNRRDKALLRYVPQSGADVTIPASLCVEAIDLKTIEDIASESHILFEALNPAAWDLANVSVSLKEVRGSLLFEKRSEPNWKRRIFNRNRLMFSEHGVETVGKFLAEYRDPVSQQLLHWFWNGETAAEVPRDWGRYLVLEESGLDVLMYDEKQWELVVPVTVPLPCLLARATALCSGLAPQLFKSSTAKVKAVPPELPAHVYSGVPPTIAEVISDKLSQRLHRTRLGIHKGVLHA